jgi:hypothetical protein
LALKHPGEEKLWE